MFLLSTGAEQLTVSPQQSFLQDNQSITLQWQYQSDVLLDGGPSPNFVFYGDGEQLETEGGQATRTYPGKPYVDYELTTRKAGLWSGEVGQAKSTAHVYGVPCKYFKTNDSIKVLKYFFFGDHSRTHYKRSTVCVM